MKFTKHAPRGRFVWLMMAIGMLAVAAMIAAAAYPKLLAGDLAEPEFSAEAALRLG